MSCLLPYRLAAASLLLFSVVGSSSSVAQQPVPDDVVDELPARVFDVRDGVPRGVITRATVLNGDNSLWLAAEEGPFRFDGRQWLPYALPDSIQPRAVRDIVATADGARWFAMRAGVLRDSAGVQRWFPLPQAPVWTLSATRVFGPETLVLATRDGLLKWTGRGFERLALPAGMATTDLISQQSFSRTGDPTLWIGSLAGGLARYHGGVWTLSGPADGLPAKARIENLAATSPGDPAELIATTPDAVYAFEHGRWRELHRGLGQHIRSARLVRNGRYETWTSLANGSVLSDGGVGRWRRIRPAGRVPSGTAQSLTTILERDGSFLVFLGYRGGELVRFRIGRAEPVDVPPLAHGRSTRRIFDDGHGHLVFGTVGGGVFETVNGRTRLVADSIEMAGLLRAAPALGGRLWLATRVHGVGTLADGRWNRVDRVPTPAPIGAFGEGPGPDGRPAIVVGTAAGELFTRRSDGWRRWTDVPVHESVRAIVTDTVRGRAVLWVATMRSLLRWDGRRWQHAGLPTGAAAAEVVDVVRDRSADGAEVLWLATQGFGLLRIDTGADTPTAVPVRISAAVDGRARFVSAISVAGPDTLLVGTSEGLLKLAVTAGGRSATVIDRFTDEDGLPNTSVTALARAADGERTWVGTLGGLSSMDVHTTTPVADVHDLQVHVLRLDSASTPIADGDRLRWGDRAMRFNAVLRTDYREDDVFYRFELRGPVALQQPWSTDHDITLRAPPSGAYVLRVWATRAFGDPVGPVQRRFSVAPPVWQSPLAYLAYLLLAGGAVWSLTSWRTQSLRHRQRQLEENEQRLAASERRFRVLFEQSVDAQLLTEGRTIIAANPAARALLADGGGEEMLRGRDAATFVPRLAAAELDPDGEETEARTVAGAVRPVRCRRTQMPLDGVATLHVELRDLRQVRALAEERAALEHQLIESQRLEALGTLAGGVAHDFNNLLTVIRNGAELAHEAERRGGTDPESLDAILQASTRARELVRQILTFSRRLPSRSDPIELHALLQELQPMLRATLTSTIRVVIDEGAPSAVIMGDRTQLVQVLVNLATNAEHAMRGRPDATFTVRTDLVQVPTGLRTPRVPLPDGTYVRLRVSDTGVGIPPDVRERVFEPFFTTKPVGEGTGLGLSVLHGIVQAHGGVTLVDSRPGEGTTFEILLPLAAEAAAAPPLVGAPQAQAATKRPLRILLVDDEVPVLSATRRILAREGHEVTACIGGAAALPTLEGPEAFDVLVTDLTMPEVSGEMLARAARRLRPTLPVILITGFGGDVERMALDAGIRTVIEKPYELQQLLGAIERVVSA